MERIGAGRQHQDKQGEIVSWWFALLEILLVSVLGVMHEEAVIVQGWDKPNLVDPQVYKLGLLQVRVLISLLSSPQERKPELLFKRGLGWAKGWLLAL